MALSILNGLKIINFNHLPVTRFSINPEVKLLLTEDYDFNLSMNYRPQMDYMKDIAAARKQKITILAGVDDELFDSSKYESVFKDAGNPVSVRLVSGVQHIPMLLDARALDGLIQLLR